MNITKFLLVLSFISLAHADGVSVKKEGGEIFIFGTTCADLMVEANAINTWRSPESRPLSKDICKCIENAQCKVNITAIVPASVLEKEDTQITKNGPNSFNASLVEAGVLSYHRYTQNSEMSFWMDSPLCKERAVDEPAKPGDIVAIRTLAGEEVQSFIHLSDKLSYSKNGFRKGTKYSLTNPDSIYTNYGVAKTCQKIAKKGVDPKACPIYANVYRCDSMDDYLKKNPMHDKDLRETWKSLDAYDCQLSKFTFKDTFTADQVNTISLSIQALADMAQTQIDSSKTSKEDKFLWKAIKFKTISLIEQIGMLN